MNKQRENQTDDPKPARHATPWARPELCRLEAGAAEFGDIANPDAQPAIS